VTRAEIDARYNRSEKGRARYRRYRERAVSSGRCRTGCGRQLGRGGTYCDECLDRLSIKRVDVTIARLERQRQAWDEGNAKGLSYPELIALVDAA
jgi:hypothetical protein